MGDNSAGAAGKPPVCEFTQEDLITAGVGLQGKCETCEWKLGFHKHKPLSKNDGTTSNLPIWKGGRSVREFIKRFEKVLTADLVDSANWPRLLLRATEGEDSDWVHLHVVEAGLKWDKAAEAFINQFDAFALTDHLSAEYEAMKQGSKESVQRYTDRYLALAKQLSIEDTNTLAIRHYLAGLQPDFSVSFRLSERTMAYHIGRSLPQTSLKEVATRAKELEEIQTPRGYGNLAGSSLSHKPGKAVKPPCLYHPNSVGHTTANCRLNPDNRNAWSAQLAESKSAAASSSGGRGSGVSEGSSSKEKKPVRCYVCKQFGHYSNDLSCPKRAERVTRAQASQSAAAFGNSVEGKRADVVPSTVAFDRTESIRSILSERKEILLMVKDKVYNTLLDTGASCSFIDEALFDELKCDLIPPEQGSLVALAHSHHVIPRKGMVLLSLIALFPHTARETIKIEHQFEIMSVKKEESDYDFIIGRDLVHTLFPQGSIPNEYVISSNKRVTQELMSLSIESAAVEDMPLHSADKLTVSTAPELEKEFSKKRLEVLAAISPLLDINRKTVGFCTFPGAEVKLQIDPKYEDKLYRRQYSVPETLKKPTTVIIDRWFREGKIVLAPPGCRYNNPICVVAKKDESGAVCGVRPCLDVRALNKALTVGDKFQIPKIREALELLAGNIVFSELDLAEAYLQFPLHPDSRPLTAFTWERQQYMFAGCPYGLTLLTSHFQRMITRIFSDLTFCYPYVDNLPFASRGWETHAEQACAIVDRCNQVNLTIKPKFNKLGHSMITCLGHVISSGGVGIDPVKMQTIKEWPLPLTGKDLGSFLGLCTYLRQHIRHYADVTATLEDMKSQEKLEVTKEYQETFDLLKDALSRAPILAYPKYELPFHIATDASLTGVGGVLFQPSKPGEHITPTNIVSICSKKLVNSEISYSAYKKELFGVIYALRKFHTYVWGRTDLVLHTDHKPLTYIFSSDRLSNPLQQWLDILLDYSFEIVHRDGILNVIPDTLSRMYGAAYERAAVWGVDGKLRTSPLLVGEGADRADLTLKAKAKGTTAIACAVTRSKSNAMSTANSSDDVVLVTETPQADAEMDVTRTNHNFVDEESDLVTELEKRGKKCPHSKEERQRIIEKAHAFGHFGREAVFQNIWRQNLWWPHIRKEIEEHLKDCDPCTRYVVVKAGYHPSVAITAGGPMDHVQIDTCVHLPPSPEGYTALLVCIDIFTGFIMLRPLKQSTAEIIANELWGIFSILGIPKIIQSDNGSEYVNAVVSALMKITGIEHRFISEYNPRADGKVERSIGTVMSIIKKLLHGTSDHWPLFVNCAQLAFNNKVANLTGSTPFSLMFGRTLNEMKDYSDTPPTQINLEDWKEHQQKIISLIYPAISDRIKSGKSQLMKSIDKKRRQLLPTSIPNGATVMVIDKNRTNKFEPKFIGPYTIIRRSRGGSYILRDMSGDMLDRRVPADQLKILNRSVRKVDRDLPIHDIDYVVNHRGDPGKYEYLIKWKNYDESENTWEPAGNFLDDKVIQEYWRSVKNTMK